eukprot:TRINITY_DN887_c0_g1_i1.p1 TRINITY_DN887_c0_g1~~TRINITY_DN887_c0_g1_i1.p1  ORF type:complete len:269 (+),score=65.56 TRINITY_DN887_c0_g1_i1:199-1005(+)
MTLPLNQFYRYIYLNGDNSIKLKKLFNTKEGSKIRKCLIDWITDVVSWLNLPSKYAYNALSYFDYVISVDTPLIHYQLILAACFSEVCEREFIPLDVVELHQYMNHLYPLQIIENCCDQVSTLLEGIEVPSYYEGVCSYLQTFLKNEEYYSICHSALDPVLEYVLSTFPFFCSNVGLMSCASAILVSETCQCSNLIKDISFVLDNPLLDGLKNYYTNLFLKFQEDNSDLFGNPSNGRKFDLIPSLIVSSNRFENNEIFSKSGKFQLIE